MMILNALIMSLEGGYQPGEAEARKKVEYRVSYKKAESRPYVEQEAWLEAARPALEDDWFKAILNTVKVTERMFVNFKARVFRMMREHGMRHTPKTAWHRTEEGSNTSVAKNDSNMFLRVMNNRFSIAAAVDTIGDAS